MTHGFQIFSLEINLCLKNSAVDPDIKMRIRIQIQKILVDPDPTWIQVISMDRAWNSDQFNFLKFKNQSWVLFVQKN